MRGAVSGLQSPTPLVSLLPGLLAGDDFAARLCAGLDEVVAPVISTLDCFFAYLDPALAPVDILGWLLGWLGVDVDPSWPLARQREAVRSAQVANRALGTIEGMRALIRLRFGVEAEVIDSGGVRGSQTPEPEPPGSPQPAVLVRIAGPVSPVQMGQLEELVAQAKPAHVAHRIEVVVA